MDELKGLTVVSVEHAVAAPYASVKLADAGARVIKVERPEGDFARGYDALARGGSAYFVWLNRARSRWPSTSSGGRTRTSSPR